MYRYFDSLKKQRKEKRKSRHIGVCADYGGRGKASGQNLQNNSPEKLEEDLKSVALLLNRQGNADKLINAANSGLEQNFGAILQELMLIVGNDKTDLNAVTTQKKDK